MRAALTITGRGAPLRFCNKQCFSKKNEATFSVTEVIMNEAGTFCFVFTRGTKLELILGVAWQLIDNV